MISAMLTLGGISALGIAILLWADRRYPEDRDSLPAIIDQLLPQTQCAQCGYGGCRPYAEAIAEGAPINLCPPGGEALIKQLGHQLNRPELPLSAEVPATPPKQIALIDESQCIGCTLCIPACPVDAIVGAQQFTHTIIESECTGCELCLPPCPVDCIVLIPVAELDTPPLRPEPHAPCIRCGECELHCPQSLAPQMLLLQRDQETVALDWNLGACIECRWCDRVCPADIPLTDIFKWMKHEDQIRLSQIAEAQHALHRYERHEQRVASKRTEIKTRPKQSDASALLERIKAGPQ